MDPKPIKDEMLKFFTHFYRPRIYIIDTDFNDGGLLLFHRYDGWDLRKDWIKPTLKNLNIIWKRPVGLISKGFIYVFSSNKFTEETIRELSFEQILENMKNSKASYK
jgi:stage V sporulation protein R